MAISLSRLSFGKSFKKLFNEYEKDLQLLLIPLLLGVILLIILLVSQMVTRQTEHDDVSAYTTLLPVHPYPMLKTVYTPTISAESAIILENDSKGILYEKNPSFRFSMASTTKIMTSLTALDYFKPDDILTVKRDTVEGSVLGLRRGEQLTFRSLLYAMLLPSANDAAYSIADNYPGGEKIFVRKMNEKAQSLLLRNTHYGDPAGLNDDEDFTTVVDLSLLTSQALKQPLLVTVVGTKQMVIANTLGKTYQLENLNQLLGMNGVTGFKTGQTTGAGGVLVTTAVKGNHTFIIVVMRSLDRFLDTQTLLQLIESNVSYFTPVSFSK